MPHKRAKASVRAARSAAQGHDLPPSASESVAARPSKASKGKRKRPEDPAGDMGGMSKNVYRILHAEKLRAEHQAKRKARKDAAEGGDPVGDNDIQAPARKGKAAATASAPEEELHLMPGEKLGDFNRRVERLMRPAMSSALKTARRSQHSKPSSKPSGPTEDDAGEETTSKAPGGIDPHASTKQRATEFAPRPTSFSLHLHDVAMEPPSLRFSNNSAGSATSVGSEPNFAKKAKRRKEQDAVDEEEEEGKMGVSRAQKRILAAEREKVIQRYRELKNASRA